MLTSLRTLSALIAFSTLALSASAAGSDWPQWRGPDRTDVSKETGLLKAWPAAGPKRLWLFENAGQGYSGPAIAKGKYYTIGTRDGSEVLLVLDANTGQELWTAKLGSILDNGWGDGPRGTPTVDGDRVYALSGPGNLVCISTTDGKILWQTTMKSLGGQIPKWGYTESVLVDGPHVLCTPGDARGTVAALDKLTGKVVWQSKDITEPAHYSSIVPAQINGQPQLVQRNEKSVFGLSPKDGKLLWQSSFAGRTAVIPTPIVRGNEVYENKVMKNHHGGVVLVGNHVYGHNDNGWVCQDFATGAEVWMDKTLGKGAVTSADGMLYCLDERSGTLVLAEASPKAWKEISRFTLSPQSKIRSEKGKIWTHPVISHGKLYLRDQELIACFELKAP
jgi:outer membrane protein assembly factor BamB